MNLPSVITLSVFLSAKAWGGPVQPGTYAGSVTSVFPGLNGQIWSAEVSPLGDYIFAKVFTQTTDELQYEEWTWNEKTLLQVESYVGKIGCHSFTYKATKEGDRYRLDCRDRETNDCDMDMDSRFYWIIRTTTDGFVMETWGPRCGEAGDAIKLSTVTFNRKK